MKIREVKDEFMCVLHVRSEVSSFKEFLKESKLPVYQSHEKGDERSKVRRELLEDYGLSCKVSEKEWDDLPGQINDAITFLKMHEIELRGLIDNYSISDIRIDFPYYCRIGLNNVFMQGEYLPAELLLMAGELGIAIALSLYPHPDSTKDNEGEDDDFDDEEGD